MAVNVPQGFNVTSNEPIDNRLIVDKLATLRTIEPGTFPNHYFTYCAEDGSFYSFDEDYVNPNTGHFREVAVDGTKFIATISLADGPKITSFEYNINIPAADGSTYGVVMLDNDTIANNSSNQLVAFEANKDILKKIPSTFGAANQILIVDSEGNEFEWITYQKLKEGNYIIISSEGEINSTLKAGINITIDSEGYISSSGKKYIASEGIIISSEGYISIDPSIEIELAKKVVDVTYGGTSVVGSDKVAVLPEIPEIVDDLTSTATDKSLSANQGKVLSDMIAATGSIKVVATEPTDPEANTIYYVGATNPYDVVFYDSAKTRYAMGTTEVNLTPYAKTVDVTAALATKQDTLTAGDHITIAADGTISAEGGGTVTEVISGTGLKGGPITTSGTLEVDTDVIQAKLTAGSGITISSANVISATGGGGGTGTVTSVSAGYGLIGGTITTSGTIAINNNEVRSLFSAGSNVTISSDGEISAIDTAYTAGTGISISGTTINTNLTAGDAIDITGDTVSAKYDNDSIWLDSGNLRATKVMNGSSRADQVTFSLSGSVLDITLS